QGFLSDIGATHGNRGSRQIGADIVNLTRQSQTGRRRISTGCYLFSPAIMDWWIDPNGAWYRPYLLWLILIVVTFILQSQRDADEL
ncbi:hypothetical protein, partial [Pseudomonas aeruginosa]|uniref:hypothetical protein n=1 Tax=Pseudomonas aeruginosa TaxID=287 RepID=UPI001D0A0BC3